MRNLESFKRLLGTEAEQYTEAQLQELHKDMYTMADLLLDIYLAQSHRNVDSRRSDGTMNPERSKHHLPLG